MTMSYSGQIDVVRRHLAAYETNVCCNKLTGYEQCASAMVTMQNLFVLPHHALHRSTVISSSALPYASYGLAYQAYCTDSCAEPAAKT